MHLPELPTIFVKGDEERKAYFTIQAKELIEAGWVIKGQEKPEPKLEAKKEVFEVIEEKPAPKTRISTKTKEEGEGK